MQGHARSPEIRSGRYEIRYEALPEIRAKFARRATGGGSASDGDAGRSDAKLLRRSVRDTR